MFAKQKVGIASAIEETSRGLRFDLRKKDEKFPAFAIRFDQQLHAYLNVCGHIAVELDYAEGQFFDDDNLLMCATHGAQYAPDTGKCLGGPCFGVGLTKLEVVEEDNILYLINSEYEVVEANV